MLAAIGLMGVRIVLEATPGNRLATSSPRSGHVRTRSRGSMLGTG
jgi:hypothetical protein